MEYKVGTEVFDSWRITDEIGEGASGKVYQIKKSNHGVTVTSALKVIRVPRSVSDIKAALSEGMDEQSVTTYFQGFVDEIIKEIALMTELKSHPNIVGYEDHDVRSHSGEIGWDILIRMELLTPLNDYQMKHTLSQEDVLRMGKELCSALVYCQKKGMIHRDIKPENIFVSDLDQFKIGDFGVARTIEKTTGGLSKKGTESYMAPEVYLGRSYGASVDIYSLGLVLYKCCNYNRLPFFPNPPKPITFADRENALICRMRGDELPPPLLACDAFAEVILKACAYDPKQRYRTAAEMLEALEKVTLTEPSSTKSPENQTASQTQADSSEYDDGETIGMYGTSMEEEQTIGMDFGTGIEEEEQTIGMDYSSSSDIKDNPDSEKTVGMQNEIPHYHSDNNAKSTDSERSSTYSYRAKDLNAHTKKEVIGNTKKEEEKKETKTSPQIPAVPMRKSDILSPLIILLAPLLLSLFGVNTYFDMIFEAKLFQNAESVEQWHTLRLGTMFLASIFCMIGPVLNVCMNGSIAFFLKPKSFTDREEDKQLCASCFYGSILTAVIPVLLYGFSHGTFVDSFLEGCDEEVVRWVKDFIGFSTLFSPVVMFCQSLALLRWGRILNIQDKKSIKKGTSHLFGIVIGTILYILMITIMRMENAINNNSADTIYLMNMGIWMWVLIYYIVLAWKEQKFSISPRYIFDGMGSVIKQGFPGMCRTLFGLSIVLIPEFIETLIFTNRKEGPVEFLFFTASVLFIALICNIASIGILPFTTCPSAYQTAGQYRKKVKHTMWIAWLAIIPSFVLPRLHAISIMMSMNPGYGTLFYIYEVIFCLLSSTGIAVHTLENDINTHQGLLTQLVSRGLLPFVCCIVIMLFTYMGANPVYIMVLLPAAAAVIYRIVIMRQFNKTVKAIEAEQNN